MGYTLSNIDHISELASEVHYIKRFIARISGREEGEGAIHEGEYQVYIYFSLEYRPVGPPDVVIRHIDDPSPLLKAAEDHIANEIWKMEKAGILKHSPFEEL